MRSTFAVGILVGALTVGALLVPSVIAGQAAQVYSVSEARASDGSGPVVVLTGKALSRFRTFDLLTAGGEPSGLALTLLGKSSDSVTLAVGGDPAAGTYLLSAAEKSGAEQSFTVALSNGKPMPGSVEGGALAAALRTDLDDAETLGGNAPSHYADAGNLSAGTLDPVRFSAYADLDAEEKIGIGPGQVAPGDHTHSGEFASSDHDHDPVYARKSIMGAKVFRGSAFPVVKPGSVVPFDSEDLDSASIHDNADNPGRLTIATTGYYLVRAKIQWVIADGGNTKMELRRNGTAVETLDEANTGTNNDKPHAITSLLHLSAGDYLEVFVYNGAGTDYELRGGQGNTEFWAVLLAE